MSKTLKIIIILATNILLAGLFIVAWVLISFQLGWADTGDHSTEALALYIGLIVFHLIFNLLFITRPKKYTSLVILVVCVFILALYGLVYLRADVFGY